MDAIVRQPSGQVAKAVEEHLAEMAWRGLSGKHVSQTRTILRKVLAPFSELSDAIPSALLDAISVVTRGRSARTRNYIRGIVGAFFGWLLKAGRVSRNPIDLVPRARQVEKTRRRGPLFADERNRLLDAVPVRRAVAYGFASFFGWRRSECKACRWLDLDLDAAAARLPGEFCKNREDTPTYLIPPRLLETLRAFRPPEAKPEDKVLPAVPKVKTLRRDLARIGVPDKRGGRVTDFHALRVTFGTELARHGVSLQLAQKLMRHSDPKLTANVYSVFVDPEFAKAILTIDGSEAAKALLRKGAA